MNASGFKKIAVILIIIFLGIVGYFLFTKETEGIKVFASKEQCEQKTKNNCVYYLCDIPIGDLYQKLCSKGHGSGWYSSSEIGDSQNAQPTPSQNSKETANWETYRDNKNGFELRYPEKYLSHPSDSDTVLLLKSDKDAQTWDIRISWYVWDSGVKNLNELSNLKNSTLLKIGSEDALKLSVGKESKQVGYIFIHNGKEYDFEVNTVNLKIMDDIDQIFSTFRFIKK